MLLTDKTKIYTNKPLRSTDVVVGDFMGDCKMAKRVSFVVGNGLNVDCMMRVVGSDGKNVNDTAPLSDWESCDIKSKYIHTCEEKEWSAWMGVELWTPVIATSGEISVDAHIQNEVL